MIGNNIPSLCGNNKRPPPTRENDDEEEENVEVVGELVLQTNNPPYHVITFNNDPQDPEPNRLLLILALPASCSNEIDVLVLPGGKSVKVQYDWPNALCKTDILFGNEISQYHPKKSLIGKRVRSLSIPNRKPKTEVILKVPFVVDSRVGHIDVKKDGDLIDGDRILYAEFEILPKANSTSVLVETKKP